MSTNPVQAIATADNSQLDNENLHSRPAQTSVLSSGAANSGTSPKQESSQPNQTSALAEFPQDEVQVQRDSQTNGDIMIRYVDHLGDLVLQVPSSQVLGLARAIDQALDQEAKARSSAATQSGNDGGNVYGH
jgi:hypothetical protein